MTFVLYLIIDLGLAGDHAKMSFMNLSVMCVGLDYFALLIYLTMKQEMNLKKLQKKKNYSFLAAVLNQSDSGQC